MKIIGDVSEEEMVSEFLRAEANSSRFEKKVLKNLRKDKISKKILLKPNIKDRKENQYRKKLLGKLRGFGQNKELFENFPKEIIWKRAIFSKKELEKVKYIDYDYWNEISNKSRLPSEAIKKIRKNEKIFDVGNDLFFEILSVIKEKKKIPRMIFVSKNKRTKIVILEGHARLTSYFLAPRYLPKEMEVIIGFSEKIKDWDFY